jgi:bifunctional oligoribonuclease and PAP phosphatase NrnA
MPPDSSDLLAVPATRRAAIHRLWSALAPGMKVALSTHVNADGDGCGSESALVRLLAKRDIDATIVNPTPWPGMFAYLLGEDVRDRSSEGPAALRGIDALVVMDISDVARLGALAETVRGLRIPKLVIDHHIASDEPGGSVMLADISACATGELVYDLARELGLEIDQPVAVGLYTALLTDTGGFRFSNTTPRCHAIAGHLLSMGVDPEEMYRRVYASVPLGRLRMLREALGTLEVDPDHGLAWLSVPGDALERYGLRSEDLDGVVEHARSIEGTRLAIFFRDLGYGKVKVSFRSTGDVDVNRFARNFGGGGHARASGALIPGTLADVMPRVLDQARAYLSNGSRS